MRAALDSLPLALFIRPLRMPAVAFALASLSICAHSVWAADLGRAERLEYRFAWNGIPAAYASVEIKRVDFAGAAGAVVTAQGRTNRFVGLFWKFRGNAQSMFLTEDFQPLSFTYERRENNKSAITWVDFDATTGRAVGTRVKKGRRESLEVDGRRFIDPIAAVFRARSRAVKVGDAIRQGVFTGERQYEITLTVLSEEPVSVPAGRFEALRLKPELERFDRDGEAKDQDRRLRNATIWVSRDPSHTLLRVRSKVFIGAVTLDLVKFSPAPTGGSRTTPSQAVGNGSSQL